MELGMTFINCTPHELVVQLTDGDRLVLSPSGTVARCATVRATPLDFSGVRLVRQSMGQVYDLPEAVHGITYVVSGMVLSALAGARADVVAPDSGADAIRENGQIVAVRGFVQ